MRLIFCFVISFIANNAIAQEEQLFSIDEIREDIQTLQNELQKRHPGLYLYSSKTEVDAYFEKLTTNLPSKTFTAAESYWTIASVSRVIKDGHTLFFPSEETRNLNDLVFPFKIFWDGNAMYIEQNLSRKTEIDLGRRIYSINGMSVEILIDVLLSGMMHDGDNETYPIWVLNMFFYEYYSYFFGTPEVFNLGLETSEGQETIIEVAALSRAEIRDRRNQLYPGLDVFSRPVGQGINFEYSADTKTGILIVPDFHVSILKQNYGQKFKKEISAIFEEIEKLKIDRLILDLRHNQGGSIKYGRILLSYLMDEPFYMVEGYQKVKSKEMDNNDSRRLKTVRGPEMGMHQPMTNAYLGELVVLVNGGSFSNSGIVSSVLAKLGRATLIGEETGGNHFTLCGDAKRIKLPNTGIQVDIPILKFLLNPVQSPWRVNPGVKVSPTIDDLIHGRDVVLEAAIDFKK